MHIAIIMDGNGRWAQQRNLPRTAGHRAGAKAVDRIVEAAARRRVGTLTLFAFSADNWHRPTAEVNALMRMLRRHLFSQIPRCLEHSIRFNVIGRRERLDVSLRRSIERGEQATAHCRGMHLRIAIDYSSQASLMALAESAGMVQAALPAKSAAGAAPANTDRARFLERLARVDHSNPPAPEVDLLIRTGGEHRLSDFLLWECAYAELYFVDSPWPDFDQREFDAALAHYASRERRFGRIAAISAAEAGRG